MIHSSARACSTRQRTRSLVRRIAPALLIYMQGHAHAESMDDVPIKLAATRVETVVVSATREQERLAETPASVGVIAEDAIRDLKPTHPQQLLSQVPGVAISVTNGEGHTTAIRQPFTTSPLYLFLEDGVPVRATGFFNHNALYELDLPLAGAIEVTRGPGSALYGSDAIGGIINMLTREPKAHASADGTLEGGSYGWRRVLLEGDTGAFAWGAMRGDFNLTHTAGWRDDTGYDRQSADLRWDKHFDENTRVKTVIAFGHIDQDTGANSPLTYDAYQHHPTQNNFSIAYRKVTALRLSMDFEKQMGDALLAITPYYRNDSMDLLASFTLNFDPTVYTSANRSYGVLAKWRQDFPALMRARVISGVDIDVSPGSRKEDRLNVTSTGSGANRVFTAYAVGPRIYDYDVRFESYAPYLHAEISPLTALRLTAGVRYDVLRYTLDNHLHDVVQGATAAYYGQAADGTVSFHHVTPKFGATFALSDRMNLYASYNQGFRVPSEGQLFRPSVSSTATDARNRAALALDLRPIEADQVEVGWRGNFTQWSLDLAAYDLQKRDDLVSQRDLATNVTTNVNAGKTSHRGLEAALGVQVVAALRLDAAWSYAKHKYVQWVANGVNYDGKEIESAPRVLGNTRLSWQPTKNVGTQLEWVRVGEYWLEPGNSPQYPKYPGHDLLNVRGSWSLSESLSFGVRVYNIADKRYADSAQVSSNTPVYSPGLPRTYYANVDARF